MRELHHEIIIRRAMTSDLKKIAPLFNEYRIFYSQTSDIRKANNFVKEWLEKNESVIFLAFKGDESV